ncbi:MAG: cobyrinate a,c-diamide synthase [Desulfatibacillaceae bacterium]
MNASIPGLVIAAPASGSGKTTVTLGMLAALTRRGMRVSPFKVGPDFIDPGHHSRVTGRTSRNLDGWMLDEATNRGIFARGAKDADIAVVEGVMGLFDGYDGRSESGSTAQTARWLGLPVLLVVDARSMARSFAALVKGFTEFDPACRFCGVVANNVGSPRHLEYLREAMEALPDVPLLGGIPGNAEIAIPERHLGLYTADDYALGEDTMQGLAALVEGNMDLDALLASLPRVAPGSEELNTAEPTVRLGVARDRAFCFYYEDNLDALRLAGCEIVPFSPIRDATVPDGLHGLYFGGGYPELFAGALAANEPMKKSVRDLCQAGMPIYGECGGFMYLSEKLVTREGAEHAMCGIFPFITAMQGKLASLGYREVRMLDDTPLGPAGATLRGHEFHYSRMAEAPGGAREVYGATDRAGNDRGCPGWMVKNCVGSYVHAHFLSNPGIAAHFAAACHEYKEGTG